MVIATWILAVSAMITAGASLAGMFWHGRKDDQRFADVHERINNGH